MRIFLGISRDEAEVSTMRQCRSDPARPAGSVAAKAGWGRRRRDERGSTRGPGLAAIMRRARIRRRLDRLGFEDPQIF
jgi:hypothetical protein